MGAWVTVDGDSVVAGMSTALGHAYGLWLVECPAKAGRLAEVLAQVLAEWREGLSREGAEVLDPDPAKVPVRVVRHVQACVQWYVALEMNASGAAVNGTLGVQSIVAPEGGTAVSVSTVGSRDGLRVAFDVARSRLERMMAGPARLPSRGTPRYGPAAARPERMTGDV